MESIGIIFTILAGFLLICTSVGILLLVIGFSDNKLDYIFPVSMFIIGMCLEYHIFFNVLTITTKG